VFSVDTLDHVQHLLAHFGSTLGRGGLLEQDQATQRYRPGILAVQLASGFYRHFDLVEQAQKEVEELARQTQHTAWLGILSGTEVVVLKTVRGSQPVQYAVEPGHHLPAHAAAMGKALLALKSDGEVRELFQQPMNRAAGRTIISIDDLLPELSLTRLRRYAVSNQELFEGVKAVSVAFEDAHKERAIALSVSYPLFIVKDKSDQPIIDTLLLLAHNFGMRIGDRRWKN
jgi:DNA-binding IclR family transcriptional regulator